MEIEEEYNDIKQGIYFMENMRSRYEIFSTDQRITKDDCDMLDITMEDLKDMGYEQKPRVMIYSNIHIFEKTAAYARMVSSTKAFESEFRLFFTKMEKFNLIPLYCPINFRSTYDDCFFRFIKKNLFRATFLGNFLIHKDYIRDFKNLSMYEIGAISRIILSQEKRKKFSDIELRFIDQIFCGIPSLLFKYMSEEFLEICERTVIEKINIIKENIKPMNINKQFVVEMDMDRDIILKSEIDSQVMEDVYDVSKDRTKVHLMSVKAVVRDFPVSTTGNFEMSLDIPYYEGVAKKAEFTMCIVRHMERDLYKEKMVINEYEKQKVYDVLGYDREMTASFLGNFLFNFYEILMKIYSHINCYELFPLITLNRMAYLVIHDLWIQCRVMEKTFLKNKLSRYKRSYEGFLFDNSVQEISSFILDLFLNGLGVFPNYLNGLRFYNSEDNSLIYLFICFLDYIQFKKGSPMYYYGLDIFCQSLQPYWNFLYFCLRTYDGRVRVYYGSMRSCKIVSGNDTMFTYSLDFSMKEKILGKYGMDILLKKEMIVRHYLRRDYEDFYEEDANLVFMAYARYMSREIGPFFKQDMRDALL
jgi:hypothetical protein